MFLVGEIFTEFWGGYTRSIFLCVFQVKEIFISCRKLESWREQKSLISIQALFCRTRVRRCAACSVYTCMYAVLSKCRVVSNRCWRQNPLHGCHAFEHTSRVQRRYTKVGCPAWESSRADCNRKLHVTNKHPLSILFQLKPNVYFLVFAGICVERLCRWVNRATWMPPTWAPTRQCSRLRHPRHVTSITPRTTPRCDNYRPLLKSNPKLTQVRNAAPNKT